MPEGRRRKRISITDPERFAESFPTLVDPDFASRKVRANVIGRALGGNVPAINTERPAGLAELMRQRREADREKREAELAAVDSDLQRLARQAALRQRVEHSQAVRRHEAQIAATRELVALMRRDNARGDRMEEIAVESLRIGIRGLRIGVCGLVVSSVAAVAALIAIFA